MRSAIDRVVPNERFVVAGESYGGYLARGLVYRRGREIDGLLLICPAIHPFERKLPPQTVVERDQELLAALAPDEAADFQRIAVIQSKRVWNRYKEEILARKSLRDVDFLMKLRTKGYSFSFDPDLLPAPFDKPAMIITGRQDHITGYEDAWRLMNIYRHTSSAGHCLTLEQEKLFHILVGEWLDRIRLRRNQ